MNKNVTTDDMDWAEMGKEEVKDHLNDADKSDISPIDNILRYRKSSSGKTMVKVTGLYELGDEAVEADDVKIDYLDTLAIYLLRTCIGVKQSQKTRFFVEAK